MLGCECKPFSDLSPFARALCVWKGAFLWCGVLLGVGGWDSVVLFLVFSFGVGYV